MKVSDVELNLKCPQCNTENKIKVGQILKEEQITCVACGFNINLMLKSKDAKAKVEKVQHSIDEVEELLTQLGFVFHWTIHREKKRGK